ncbi:hypothetical protein ABGB12_03645 [Actinocorallia sp. B10E7]|uniref:hypothetical protein n=1 Tax=Actinocorallia sp. B10E7 TaxID=3153558 RepID=UPI00325E8EF9
MMRLLVFCSVLALASTTGCEKDRTEPAPVPYTAVPQTPPPFEQPTAPVFQP